MSAMPRTREEHPGTSGVRVTATLVKLWRDTYEHRLRLAGLYRAWFLHPRNHGNRVLLDHAEANLDALALLNDVMASQGVDSRGAFSDDSGWQEDAWAVVASRDLVARRAIRLQAKASAALASLTELLPAGHPDRERLDALLAHERERLTRLEREIESGEAKESAHAPVRRRSHRYAAHLSHSSYF